MPSLSELNPYSQEYRDEAGEQRAESLAAAKADEGIEYRRPDLIGLPDAMPPDRDADPLIRIAHLHRQGGVAPYANLYCRSCQLLHPCPTRLVLDDAGVPR